MAAGRLAARYQTATLEDASGQYPVLTPDLEGVYTLEVTDLATSEVVALQIYAGLWEGVITGQDEHVHPQLSASASAHDDGGLGSRATWAYGAGLPSSCTVPITFASATASHASNCLSSDQKLSLLLVKRLIIDMPLPTLRPHRRRRRATG